MGWFQADPAHFHVQPFRETATWDSSSGTARKKETLDQGWPSETVVMDRIAEVFTGNRRIGEDLMDDLEALILSDVGIDTRRPSSVDWRTAWRR